jgi:catechol 2,3-dioxygenase-like lactoylglutathione lyase family enzyme
MHTNEDDVTPYAPLTQQLVLEIYCTSLSRSIDFYTSLGFHLNWRVPDYFAQVAWQDGCLLFLKTKQKNGQPSSHSSAGNLRVMVENVDALYQKCVQLGYDIVQDIGDRKFVLRDFIISDPDGFGLRFGSFLPDTGREEQNGPIHEIVIRYE